MILKYLMFICFFMLPEIYLMGQDKEMFIEQIANKTITRESYNVNGKLTGKQEFFTQKLNQTGDDFLLNIDTKIYDEAQRLKSTYTNQIS